MLEHVECEGIHYWKVARSYFGRSLYVTGFYLVDDVLIDCGPPNAHVLLRRLFADIPARRLLITHHHEDHTGNAAYLNQQHGYTVSGHAAGERQLETISHGVPFYRRVVWGTPSACSYDAVSSFYETNLRQLETIETPGHSDDHLCFYDREKGWLFTGDLYLSGHLRYLRRDENIQDLMKSLRLLANLKPRLLFCNHRGPVPDGEVALARKISFLERLQDQVQSGIEKGMTPEELTNYLLKKDIFFRRFSAGELSSLNLIQAFANCGPTPRMHNAAVASTKADD